MSWLNMDASNGFHFNSFDSNSICFYQLRQDSPLEHPPLLFDSPFQDSCQQDLSINFEYPPNGAHQKQQHEDSDGSAKDLDLNEESYQWKNQGTSAKKGLKYLARLVLKILKNRPLQQGEIVYAIQSIICKEKHEVETSSKQESVKQEKNVKRRIYDALNVMISAEILEKDEISIKIKQRKQSIEILLAQPSIFEDIYTRIQKKRQLFQRLISKKKALQYWIRRNKTKKVNQKSECLSFPLIFVMEKEENFWMSHLRECFLMKSKQLQLFSETDIIECVHHAETDSPTSLVNYDE